MSLVSSGSHTTGVTTLTSVDPTLGAILVGGLLSMTLWGISCTQTFDYFMNNRDGPLQRSIVALLWSIDTLSSAMVSHLIYNLLVTNYRDSFAHGTPWSMNCQSLVAGLSNLIIRTMFARRIYQFSQGKIIIPAWIVILSVCDLVVNIIQAVMASGVVTLKVIQNLGKLLYITTALGVTADLSVTIALCWLLQSAKTGFRRSDSLVNFLMAYVVNTGLLVTIFAILGLITYVVMPDNLVFVAFMFLVNKLYVNAYLASLTSRRRLRSKSKNSNSNIPLSALDMPVSQRKNTQGTISADEKASHFHRPALEISFQTTVERNADDVAKNPTHTV